MVIDSARTNCVCGTPEIRARRRAFVSQGPDAVNVARYMASANVEIALFVNRRSAEEWLDARQRA